MIKTRTTYRIPVKLHGDKAWSKARVYGYERNSGGSNSVWLPCPGTRIVTVEAASHAEAYRLLLAAVRPGDDRPIMSKTLIKFFREQEAIR